MKNIVFFILTGFLSIPAHGQSSGEPDMTFAENGVYRANISAWDVLNSFVLQPDGKIVAAGFTEKDDLSQFLLVRLLPDGNPDLNFGTMGIVETQISSFFFNEARALALQPDGKMLIGGVTTPNEKLDFDFALLRFHPNGTLDTGFNGDGKVVLNIGKTDRIQALAVLPDGKILAAGVSNPTIMSFSVAQFLPDGTLDTNFGGGKGYVLVSFGTSYDVCSSMTIQPDGKILLVGSSVKSGYPDIALVRLLANGVPDATFGSNGKVTTAFGTTTDTGLKAVVQPDGKILVCGISNNAQNKSELALFRYNTYGGLDPSFGTNGKVRSPIGSQYSAAETVALRPDGKILVAGTAQNSATGLDFAMKQFNPDGTVDASFGTGGVITADLNSGPDGASEILYTDDGRILIAGSGYNAETQNTDLVIMRYLSDLYVGVVDAPQSLLSPWIYPNPVSAASVSVQYELRNAEDVFFELYTANGTLIAMLNRGRREAGKQTEELSLPAGLQNGPYVLNVHTQTGNTAIRILLAQ